MVLTALAIITAVARGLHVLQLAVVVAGRRGLVGRRSAWPRNRLCRDLRGDRAVVILINSTLWYRMPAVRDNGEAAAGALPEP